MCTHSVHTGFPHIPSTVILGHFWAKNTKKCPTLRWFGDPDRETDPKKADQLLYILVYRSVHKCTHLHTSVHTVHTCVHTCTQGYILSAHLHTPSVYTMYTVCALCAHTVHILCTLPTQILPKLTHNKRFPVTNHKARKCTYDLTISDIFFIIYYFLFHCLNKSHTI